MGFSCHKTISIFYNNYSIHDIRSPLHIWSAPYETVELIRYRHRVYTVGTYVIEVGTYYNTYPVYVGTLYLCGARAYAKY